MKPYGLILAGGGAKGAYQIGAWRALREMGIEFSAVAGASIGSINGALIIQGAFDEALELWNNVSVEKGVNINEALPDPSNLFSVRNIPVLFKEIIKNGGIDASPTKELLLEYIDEAKIRASGIDFGLVTFQLNGFNPLELFIDDIPNGSLVDYLLASSHVPGVSKIGPQGESFLDGGVYDNAPIGMLRRRGYNRLIVIDISSMKGIGHKTDISCAEIVYIRPYDVDDLGAAFEFDETMVKNRFDLGYYDARKAFGFYSGNIFYFEPETFFSLVAHYGASAVEQLEKLAFEMLLPRIHVYEEDEFLFALRHLVEEKKLEEERAEEEKSKNRPRIYESIIKKLPSFKSGAEYAEAIEVLEKIAP